MARLVRRLRRVAQGGCAILLLAAPLAHAGTLAVGQALPAMTLFDQHERPVPLDANTRLVLFAADKAAGDLMQGVLAGLPAGALGQHAAVYVADISGMPAMVTRLFALPALREQAYPVALGRLPGDTAALPRKKGAVTVMRFDRGALRSVDYLSEPGALGALLKP
jgi:hypothetical protein